MYSVQLVADGRLRCVSSPECNQRGRSGGVDSTGSLVASMHIPTGMQKRGTATSRIGLISAVAALALAGAYPAGAEPQPVDVSRAEYVAAGLAGHPELRNGTVLDVTFGHERGALELHRVSGAAPEVQYQVLAEIFLASACDYSDPLGPFPFPEGTLSTDRYGNGSFVVRFPAAAFDPAPDSFWVGWSLSADGQTAYRTPCVLVELGGEI